MLSSRDCKSWNYETGECDDSCNSRRMTDSWFCCFAEPLTPEQARERDKHMKEINDDRYEEVLRRAE